MTFFKRRAAVVAAVVAAGAAVFCAGTSAHETIVHAYRQPGGTVVVSGYDGGVALAPSPASK
ncbi:MAG: hypothetical protein WAK93_01015 [Solirubrobacteraceae bacterium]